jgi:hypothetical protein
MANENQDDLVGRVAKIEKQVRWWRRCSLLLLLLVGITALLGMGRADSQSLRVRSLTVVNDDDKPRVKINVKESGGGVINVFNRDGHLGGSLSVSEEGAPFLALYGRKEGKPFVQAYMALSDEGPSISLLNKNGDSLFRAPPVK